MPLPKELTTVTPTSKLVALIMFITLPFIGFLLGIQYQSSQTISTQEVMQIDQPLDSMTKYPPTLTPPPNILRDTTRVVDDLSFPSNVLPGFSMNIPKGWVITQKAFGDKTPNTFESLYFPSCHEQCKGIRLSKENISFELLFDVAFDSNGVRCSNTVEFQQLSNGWYRINDAKRYFYSKSVELNSNHTEFQGVSERMEGGNWTTLPQGKYKICIYGSGTFLKQYSPVEKGNEQFGVPILLEHPRIQGMPDQVTLQEIDTIISSIKGID